MKLTGLHKRISSLVVYTSFILVALSPDVLAQDNRDQREQNRPQTQTARTIVSGRAVYEDTAQPAQRERIQLVEVELLSSRRGRIPTVLTDENGEFSFRGISAGEYYVVAHPVDEHVTSARGAPFPLQTGDPAADAARLAQYKKENIKVTVDGFNAIRIDLRVRNPHLGTLSGRVVSDDGKPAVGAQVNLTTKTESVAHSFVGAYARTDDEGFYRFRGLPAGEYAVSANPPSKTGDNERPSVGTEGLLGATYYPSMIDAQSSPDITVYADRETSDINITLVARKLHTIGGIVMMQADGRPVSGAIVSLSKKDEAVVVQTKRVSVTDAMMSHYSSTTDAKGRWSIHNLTDGSYLMHVMPKLNVPGRESNVMFVEKRKEVTIAGSDLEDVLIEVSSGASISGTVIVEGN